MSQMETIIHSLPNFKGRLCYWFSFFKSYCCRYNSQVMKTSTVYVWHNLSQQEYNAADKLIFITFDDYNTATRCFLARRTA